jgi:ABC-type nitrate/sulfonate/bicarbonate transport system substrate-binding protein
MFGLVEARRRRLIATMTSAAIGAAALAACSSGGGGSTTGSATAAGSSMPVVTLAEVAQSTLDADIYVASTLGYFTKAGVKVNVVNFGATGTTAVVAGKADLVTSGLSSALSPINSGKGALAVYALQNGFSTAGLYVSTSGTTHAIQDLSGKSIVSLGAGTASYGAGKTWSTYVVNHGGKPVNVIPAASSGAKTNLLLSGQVAATVGQADQVTDLVSENKIKFLVNPESALAQQVFGPISGPKASTSLGIWGMQSWIDANRQTVVKVLAAIREGDIWLQQHSVDQAATEMEKFPLFKSADLSQPQIALAWQQDKPFAAQTLGQISPQAWAATIQLFQSFDLPFNVTQPTFGYGKVVDMSFLTSAAELDQKLFK